MTLLPHFIVVDVEDEEVVVTYAGYDLQYESGAGQRVL